MENRTEDFIGMVKLTETVWIEKQSIFGSVVAVKEAFTRLTALKEAILELSENQSKTIGGQTINKKNLRKQINELAAQIGQITAAYALSAKNEVLRKAVNFPLSHYQLSRDEEVIELCRNVAKEAKIVEAMRKEGIKKEDLGRDGFLKRAWDWKKQYGGRIVEQLKKLGSSCDWERERFTMDEGCNQAVKEVFIRYYEDL